MNFKLWHVNHIKLMSYNNSLLSPQSRKERGEKHENSLASPIKNLSELCASSEAGGVKNSHRPTQTYTDKICYWWPSAKKNRKE
jgi:hypothetical protein